MRKAPIILHENDLTPDGAVIHRIGRISQRAQPAHRDDHYMFVIVKSGEFVFELDFKELRLTGPAICFVSPGQVHHYITVDTCEGWLVFADKGIVTNEVRSIFQTLLNARQTATIKEDDPLFKLVPVLQEIIQGEALPLRKYLVRSVIETIGGLVASYIVQSQSAISEFGGRKHQTAVHFRQLVSEKWHTLKQVKGYADLLNITPLYLNEVIKEVTGFTASYWINQEIMLEAKRLLYYTPLDVKQIAYELGYEDHAYFSRFFKKQAGVTALAFRNTKPSIVQS